MTKARLEHANLMVTGIDETANFLLAAFPHWSIRGEGGGEWYGVPRRWAHIGDDYNYITLNEFFGPKASHKPQRDLAGTDPGLAHLAFEVDDLDAIVSRLNKIGYESHNLGEDHPHRRNNYFKTKEGIEFEFVQYFSDKPEERNLYA